MGTPEFAVPSLRAVSGRCDLCAVVTQPDRGSGRGRRSSESAVATAAGELGVDLIKPDDVNASPVLQRLKELRADLFAVVAFGGILSPEVLGVPALGCMNLHGSLLPDYRGASPVQRALWDGLPGTGVTTLWMDEGIDTGDVVLQQWVPIDAGDDAGSLASRLAETGAPLLAESLVRAHRGDAPRQPQERASGSYAKKLTKADGLVNWALDAVTVWNHQRAVTPWPGATASFDGHPLRLEATRPEHLIPIDVASGTVLSVDAGGVTVACAPGALRLLRVRPASRPSMDAAAWARGARVAPGATLAAGAPGVTA